MNGGAEPVDGVVGRLGIVRIGQGRGDDRSVVDRGDLQVGAPRNRSIRRSDRRPAAAAALVAPLPWRSQPGHTPIPDWWRRPAPPTATLMTWSTAAAFTAMTAGAPAPCRTSRRTGCLTEDGIGSVGEALGGGDAARCSTTRCPAGRTPGCGSPRSTPADHECRRTGRCAPRCPTCRVRGRCAGGGAAGPEHPAARRQPARPGGTTSSPARCRQCRWRRPGRGSCWS